MQERDRTLIAQAQQGDKESLEIIIKENKRIDLEYSKKVFRKRI